MVVHYPRTVWKNSYAEHEITGKTYKKKEEKGGGKKRVFKIRIFIGKITDLIMGGFLFPKY